MDAHIGSHTFYEDLYRSNRIITYVVPFVIAMLLARDSIVGIPYCQGYTPQYKPPDV